MSMGVELARSSYSRLYLIENEKNVVFLAYSLDILYVFLFKQIDSALALYDFKHYRADSSVKLFFQSFEIVCGNVTEALGEREEETVEYILTRSGKRGYCSSVE